MMSEKDSYRTITEKSTGLYREKGSRFIAIAFPVTSAEEVKEIVDNLKKEYYDARHHCYAYMLGADRLQWRANDDGEPSGTAGKPILGQINTNDLTDILIVVIRYFGGSLLGVAGLINAYRSAASDAIISSTIVTRQVTTEITISFKYLIMNDVMKILKEYEVNQTQQRFDNNCSITISIPISIKDIITGRLAKLEGLRLFRD